MAEQDTSPKKVRLSKEITGVQEEGGFVDLSETWKPQSSLTNEIDKVSCIDAPDLDEAWEGKERARFQMASVLAIGLLVLFGFIIFCNGNALGILMISSAFGKKSIGELAPGVDLLIAFATKLLPYVATPLGVALGYFFRESQEK